jgi:MFS transporter, DHA1 family, tetracycline resistance protein
VTLYIPKFRFPTFPLPAAIGVGLFFLGGLADGLLMPFFAIWAETEAQVPTEYIGLLLACYAGGELLAAPFIGGIADRLGRRPVLFASTLGIGLGFMLLYCTHGVFAAALSLLLVGVFEGVFHPTAAAVIADVTPADGLRERYAMMRMASHTGHLIGPACGAIIVQWSLALVFLGASVSMLIGAAIVVFLLKETWKSGVEAEDDDDGDFAALGTAFRDPRLAMLLLPVSLMGIATSWIESILPLYAVNAGTLSVSSIGLLFTYAAFVGIVLQLPVLKAVEKQASGSVILAASLILVGAFGSLAISPELPFLVVALTGAVFADMLSGPLTQTIATELAPAKARATYMAAFSAAGDLKDAAGPALGTTLYALASRLPWLVGIPLAIGAGAFLALVARRHEARPKV